MASMKEDRPRSARSQEENRDLGKYIGYDVIDRQSLKIGTLEALWSDHTGEPAFIGVKTGWIFGKTHVVPANNVQVNERERVLRIPYDKDKVKDAPSYDADSEMDERREAEIYQYYGVARSTQPQGNAQSTTQRPAQQSTQRPAQTGATAEQATIGLSSEELKVGKRQVEAGGVRLRKIIRTETVNQPVQLQREEIVIERVPAGEAQAGTSQKASFEGEELYIPLRREEVVIEKEARLREEVRVRKETQTEQQQVSEQVRREDIEVEARGEAERADEARRTGKPGEQIREREERPRSQRRRE